MFLKNKLLGIGTNQPTKTHSFVMKYGNQYNLDVYKNYPYPHAEISAISKTMWMGVSMDKLTCVVIRVNKGGELRNSKPCKQCQTVMDAVGIGRVLYSVDNGIMENGKLILAGKDIL